MNVSDKIFKKNKEILLFFSVFFLFFAKFSSRCLLYCAGHNFIRKIVSLLLTKFPPFCTVLSVHTNINKSFNSFYILHNFPIICVVESVAHVELNISFNSFIFGVCFIAMGTTFFEKKCFFTLTKFLPFTVHTNVKSFNIFYVLHIWL